MTCFTVLASSYVLYLSLLHLCSKVQLACENTPIKQWRKQAFHDDLSTVRPPVRRTPRRRLFYAMTRKAAKEPVGRVRCQNSAPVIPIGRGSRPRSGSVRVRVPPGVLISADIQIG